MTPDTRRPGHARPDLADGFSRGQRLRLAHVADRGPAAERARTAGGSADPDARGSVALRCPGPLVALRALAALYGVSAEHLAACLAVCETNAHGEREMPAGVLAAAVTGALGTAPLAPTAVHYFLVTPLAEPALVFEHGLRPPPSTPEAVWARLGELVRGDIGAADWTSLQPAADVDGPYRGLLQAAHALSHGPSGSLVRDVALHTARNGAHDGLTLAALVTDIAPACAPCLGFDLEQRFGRATTPCVVEYRRRPAREGEDVAAALSFVAAALRGSRGAPAIGAHDARRAAIAAPDIVSVRALATQAEWTRGHG